jgi:hypothetical protein
MQPIDLLDDPRKHRVQVAFESLLTEIQKVHLFADPARIEEFEQLLVTQHFQRRLAK